MEILEIVFINVDVLLYLHNICASVYAVNADHSRQVTGPQKGYRGEIVGIGPAVCRDNPTVLIPPVLIVSSLCFIKLRLD
jgi:hypothetical protein